MPLVKPSGSEALCKNFLDNTVQLPGLQKVKPAHVKCYRGLVEQTHFTLRDGSVIVDVRGYDPVEYPATSVRS